MYMIPDYFRGAEERGVTENPQIGTKSSEGFFEIFKRVQQTEGPAQNKGGRGLHNSYEYVGWPLHCPLSLSSLVTSQDAVACLLSSLVGFYSIWLLQR